MPGRAPLPPQCGERCPTEGVPPTALARPAPGERTISNAEVPLPRSPLSLATGTAHRKACSIGFAPKRRLPAALGTCLAGTISAVGGSVQGCRGRSPRRNKLWDSPFPPGRGAGGWGKEIKPKARLAGDKDGKPPFGHRQHPPPRRPAGQATHRASATQVQPVPLSARARGCKGRSPLHENNLNLPLPRRGRGAGGWGKEIKPKARLAGDQPGKPPIGHHSGWDSQCRRGTPPHRAPQRQG